MSAQKTKPENKITPIVEAEFIADGIYCTQTFHADFYTAANLLAILADGFESFTVTSLVVVQS